MFVIVGGKARYSLICSFDVDCDRKRSFCLAHVCALVSSFLSALRFDVQYRYGSSWHCPAPRPCCCGAVMPYRYICLWDELGFGADGLQCFTYWLCYLYCRCARCAEIFAGRPHRSAIISLSCRRLSTMQVACHPLHTTGVACSSQVSSTAHGLVLLLGCSLLSTA